MHRLFSTSRSYHPPSFSYLQHERSESSANENRFTERSTGCPTHFIFHIGHHLSFISCIGFHIYISKRKDRKEEREINPQRSEPDVGHFEIYFLLFPSMSSFPFLSPVVSLIIRLPSLSLRSLVFH